MAKGWLDNYGKEDNYNDSSVSAPEGFQGDGYSNVGRNYSPAWGGQFQKGGKLTFLQPTSDKLPEGYIIPYDTPSSERAMSIGGENGEPAYLIPSFKYGRPLNDPIGEFKKTGEHLGGPFKTWKEAEKWEKEVRHPAVEKKENIMFPIKEFQMGGNVYPVNYVPQAQDGNTISNLGQEGIDFLQSIYRNHPPSTLFGRLPFNLGSGIGLLQSHINKEPEKLSDQLGVFPNPYTQVASLVALEAEAEKENMHEFAKNKNRGKDLKKIVPKKESNFKISDDRNFQMGGSLPGATGHMYARIGAPSNGKYAKKTLASAQDGKKVKYGTPEYEEAYNKGEVITKEGVRSPILLDEVVVKGKKKDKNWLEQYADKIVDENKDAGVLGAILGTPISAVTSLPQLMGMKAITGEMERPSEGLDIENPYGAMAVDAIADPANLIGVGELSGLSKLSKEQALSKLANVKNIRTSISPELRQGLQTNGLLDIIKPSENYVKGVKKLIPEGKKLKSRTSEELKKLELALSPNTVKALGRLDNNISEQMLQKYTWGEYATPKEFRLDVKKAILESERLKKINPSADFSTDTFNDKNLTGSGMDWLLSQPKYLSSFLDAKEVAKKTIQNKEEVKNFLEKSYTSKMDLINQDPILKNIAKESPQYTDLIYDHLKNPTKSTDDFVNDLVKQSNTFTRSMRKSIGEGEISKEDFFTPKGGSMGFANRNTIDVEGFPTSGDYGSNTYKIFPSAERMEDVANTPLEQRWDKRFPNTFPGNENIDFGIGLHSSVKNDFLHNAEVQRRLRNHNSVKYTSGVMPTITKSEIIPDKYLYQPKHVVFNVPKNTTEMIKGFDVEQVGDAFNRFKASGKFGSEPGYTHGFKDGGVIKDDMGQWAHPGEVTEINSNDITMEGVPYDVLGISDTGDTKLMKPGKNYKFKGKKVTEYPMAKNGLRQEQKGLQNLDQLTNFTNYNTKQPGGWLDTL